MTTPPTPEDHQEHTSRTPPEPTGLPARTLAAASVCALVWHGLWLVVGSLFFVPPQVVETPRTPQEIAARIIADEASHYDQPWYQWDALWFVHLSRFGYRLETSPEGRLEQSNIAFTPGLALVAAASDRSGADPWRFLLGFNLVAATLATMGLGVVTWHFSRSRAAMIWAMVAFSAWPWRFFLVAPYQEAAGTALAFWAIYAICADYAVAGFVCSLLASAFRLNAVGLFGGLIAGGLVEFARGRERPAQIRRIVAGTGALIGWGALLGYFRWKFGDASLGVTIQSTWGRQPPHLTGVLESLGAPMLHRMTGSEWLDWAAAWAVVAMIPLAYRKYGLVWASSLAGLTLQALSTGRVLSFGRFALMACPFFVVLGWLGSRWPRTALALCALGAAAQAGLAWRYGHGSFAG